MLIFCFSTRLTARRSKRSFLDAATASATARQPAYPDDPLKQNQSKASELFRRTNAMTHASRGQRLGEGLQGGFRAQALAVRRSMKRLLVLRRTTRNEAC
ncbi:hypothetical protein L1887_58797 [Cichorium endivia]|nr:hypothetical protein L1887_58797 [Cichorium endivia]